MKSEEQAFLFDSGNLALDLLNTLSFEDGEPIDRIASPAGLASWLERAGLVPASHRPATVASPASARILLTEAHRLRDDLGRAMEARRAGQAPEPHILYGLNRVLGAGRVTTELAWGDGNVQLVEREAGEGPLPLLSPVVRAAGELLAETDPRRIRRCASSSCARWFVDTSKGGRRRWCSMSTCGNRAKAEAHRRRHAAD